MWTSQQYMVVTDSFYIRLHKFNIYFFLPITGTGWCNSFIYIFLEFM